MDKDKLCEEAMKKYYHSILRYCLQLLGQDLHSAETLEAVNEITVTLG